VTDVTSDRSPAGCRFWVIGVAVSVAAILAGLGGPTVAATAQAVGRAAQPQTLLVSPDPIWAFAMAAGRLTWVSRAQVSGRGRACGMYVRVLRTGRTSIAPLPAAACSRRLGGVQLGSGEAAWINGYACSNLECDWSVMAINGGARRARVVESPGLACDFACGDGYAPVAALAGVGGLLVYSRGGLLGNDDQVNRIVGGRPSRLFTFDGELKRLAVGGGGVVETVSRVLALGDGCGCLSAPAWSPDGSKIAYYHGVFSGDVGLKAGVAVMNADGSDLRDLTAQQPLSCPCSLSWSPDGKRIAYDTSDGIAVVGLDGSGSLRLGTGDAPAWSPDGSKIAFGNENAIFVMNPDGSGRKKLASLSPGRLGYGGLAWSPDGTRIAFSMVRKGAFYDRLEVMNADGSNLHPLGTKTAGDEEDPTWSPGGSQILFDNAKGLALIGADGSGVHQLTHGGSDFQPSWSPDGKTIVFASLRDDPYYKLGERGGQDYRELYLMNSDGSNLRPLSFTRPSRFEQQATLHSAAGRPLASLRGLPTLAGRIAAIASVSSSGTDEIALFNAHSGAKLVTVSLGQKERNFSLADANKHWIVFQRGTTIAALNVTSHRVVALTRGVAKPLDLSVSGHRIAWAENSNGLGRIRAIELPN
jgi:Tol biopolymer transport system component